MMLKNLTHLDDGMISAQVINEDGTVTVIVFDSLEVLQKEMEVGRQALGRYSTNGNRTMH